MTDFWQTTNRNARRGQKVLSLTTFRYTFGQKHVTVLSSGFFYQA